MKKLTLLFIVLLMFVCWRSAPAQQPIAGLLKQITDTDAPIPLSAEELDALGDPFFNLVLKTRSDVTRLSEVEDLVQPSRSDRRTFVVSEQIADQTPGLRRAVITFTGSRNEQALDSNVMLSVFFDNQGFAEGISPIEVLGWDAKRGRYNYYKLDDSHAPGRLAWKFRGSSDGADRLSPRARAGTCMACHINGAPIMKELLFPWNNWHSFKFQVPYLSQTNPNRWPVSRLPRLTQNTQGAETLESTVIESVRRFNGQQIDHQVTMTDGARPTVTSARRLLRPLFVTTEFNIISAQNESGMHPLRKPAAGAPRAAVAVPNTVFLNANLISGNTIARYRGLGISAAQGFSTFCTVQPEEYRTLVSSAGVKLGDVTGDALFAWIAPEPSHIDIDLVDQLIRRGVITPEFAAAVLAIDLENPILSPDRESLLTFVPDAFTFVPLSDGADSRPRRRELDELTRAVIASLVRANPQPDTPAFRFLARLRHDDPVKALEEDIANYQARLQAALANPQLRMAELRRLYSVTVARRAAVLRHPVLGRLDETQGLLMPIP
jgi:hypothetical protein